MTIHFVTTTGIRVLQVCIVCAAVWQLQVTDEPDLDFLPDPDKIYGPANDASDNDKYECGSSDGDYSLKVRNKSRRGDDDVDDGFDSCEFDSVSSDEESKQKIQKRFVCWRLFVRSFIVFVMH